MRPLQPTRGRGIKSWNYTSNKDEPIKLTMHDFSDLLYRSKQLEDLVFDLLNLDEYLPTPSTANCEASVHLSLISIEHSCGLRELVPGGFYTPAISLMRLQFEALVRATWTMWGATDADIQRLRAPLTSVTEKDASKLPNVGEMLKRAAAGAPSGLVDQLSGFKVASVPALNSFVHGGIHALSRRFTGYPAPLVDQVVRQSNALMTMAGMLLAVLSGEDDVREEMSLIQRPFADCLPALVSSETVGTSST